MSTGYRANAAGARRASEDAGHVRVLVSCDFGLALAAAILAFGWASQSLPGWLAAFVALGIAVFGLLVGLFAAAMAMSVAVGVAVVLMVLARKSSGVIRRAPGVVFVVAVVVVVLAAWWVALGAVAWVASALPSLLPLGCGAYVGVLLYRDDPRPGKWADVFLAGAVGVGLAAAFRPGIVADDPASPLFFIAIVWLAVRLWRSMRDSDNRLVRGSADVATALLLGATLDLVVVWAGNLVGLPALTVLRVSRLLNAIADGNDPAWWYLAVPLLLLTACYVALIRWESRLADLGAWARRRRVVRSAGKMPGISALRPRQALTAFESSSRLMRFLHVGLLLVPLVGITAPALLGQSVLGPLRPRYFIAYDAERHANAQTLAYQQLTREVAAASPSQRAALQKSAEGIIASTVNGGSGGAADYWFTSSSPALNLGEEEGAYLQYSGEGATEPEPAPPPLATGSATTVAAQVEAEEGDADADESYADKAGASAAAAIATLLSIPPGGGAVQILQEYLGGLTEESPVADALAGLAGRLGGTGTGDPDVEQAFSPGPAEQAAASGEISPSDDNGSTGSGGGSSTGNGGGTDDGGDDGGGDSGGGVSGGDGD